MTISTFIKTLIALISKFAPLRHVEWRSGIGLFGGLASDTSSLKLFSFSFASHPNTSLDPLLSDRHRHRAIATSRCTFRVHGERWNPRIISQYFFTNVLYANVDLIYCKINALWEETPEKKNERIGTQRTNAGVICFAEIIRLNTIDLLIAFFY